MPELSIIVPVYNVEEYLPKCIDSILAQTFTDFELILIDDGSPDRCGEICDEYAAKDNRIIVIHQENKGVSAARNAGLDIAKGAYIGFVDSDDWIEPEMYEKALGIARGEYDIVTFGIRCFGVNEITVGLNCEAVLDRAKLLAELVAQPNRIGGGVVNKLFLKSIVEGIRFPETIAMCEDRIFLFSAFLAANKCKSSSYVFYNVLGREGSAIRSNNPTALRNIILGDRILVKLYRKHMRELYPAAVDKLMAEGTRLIPQIRELQKSNGKHISWIVLQIKVAMAIELISGLLRSVFPRTKIHSYIGAILNT